MARDYRRFFSAFDDEDTAILRDTENEMEKLEHDIDHAKVYALAMGKEMPSDLHKAVYQLLLDLIGMITEHQEDVPAALRILTRTFKRLENTVLEELTAVSEDQIRAMLIVFRDRIDTTLNTTALTTAAPERMAGMKELLDDSTPTAS
jgi:predicted DNA-binding helix-hairpin-helix protein